MHFIYVLHVFYSTLFLAFCLHMFITCGTFLPGITRLFVSYVVLDVHIPRCESYPRYITDQTSISKSIASVYQV